MKITIDPTGQHAAKSRRFSNTRQVQFALVEMLGYIPYFLRVSSSPSAAQAIHENYLHGGGWQEFLGHEYFDDGSMQYPGDPRLYPIAGIIRGNEVIYIYEHGWVTVRDNKGEYHTARID